MSRKIISAWKNIVDRPVKYPNKHEGSSGLLCTLMLIKSTNQPINDRQFLRDFMHFLSGIPLQAMLDILTIYKSPSKALSCTSEDLYKITTPFIAYCNMKDFIIIDGFDAKGLWIKDPSSSCRFISRQEMEDCFSDVVVTLHSTLDKTLSA